MNRSSCLLSGHDEQYLLALHHDLSRRCPLYLSNVLAGHYHHGRE
jgi:hypothetical protein